MKTQLYLVWAVGMGGAPSDIPSIHLRPVPKGPVARPENWRSRVIRASSPRRAVRKFVRACLPLLMHLAEDGSHEPQDITHAKPGPKAGEKRHWKRHIRRNMVGNRGQLLFQLHV